MSKKVIYLVVGSVMRKEMLMLLFLLVRGDVVKWNSNIRKLIGNKMFLFNVMIVECNGFLIVVRNILSSML